MHNKTEKRGGEANFSGVHEEFVKVIQGASSLYRFGSDRINNAEHYCNKHAEAMMTFSYPELHPDTCAMYRHMARIQFDRICNRIKETL